MKVQSIHIDRFKKLENIDAQFDGKHVLICGPNAIGKSSVMQFINIAFGDKNHIPPNAEGSGYVITDKGGRKYKFNVEFEDGKPKVTITTPEGIETSKKGALAAICGAMDFDIYEFVEQSKSEKGRKDQIKTFKSFLPQETQEQLQVFENRVTSAYDERTGYGQKVKELQSLVKNHPLSGQTLSQFKPVDLVKLNAEKDIIRKKLNDQYVLNKSLNEKLRNEFDALKETTRQEIANFNALQAINKTALESAANAKSVLSQLGFVKENLIEFVTKLAENIKADKEFKVEELTQPNYVTEIPDDSEIKAIDEQITNAIAINEKYKQAQELQKLIEDLDAMRENVADLTVIIETERQAISDAIKDMANPVEGLAFDDQNLIYNGIPVNPDCLSTSEIMVLGAKLELVKNKELGILFVPGAESMGIEKRKELVSLVEAIGGQLIMEQVVEGKQEIKFELFTQI